MNRRHARPRRKYDLRIVWESVIVFAAILVLIVITSTGYPR